MSQGDKPQSKGKVKANRRAQQQVLLRQREEREARERRQQTIVGAIVVAVVVVIIAVIAFFALKPMYESKIAKSSSDTVSRQKAYEQVQKAGPKPTKASKKGGFLLSKNGYNKPVADVPTIAIYSDPLCPGCGSLHRTLDSTLKSMMDAGQINLEEHFMIGLDSLSTDEYSSRATGAITYIAQHDDDPKHLMDFVDNLFAEGFQPEEGEGYKSVSDARIREQALNADVPKAVVDKAFGRTYQKWLTALQAYTPTRKELLNVSGPSQIKGKMTTPTITINGHFIDQNVISQLNMDYKQAVLKSIGLSQKQVGKTDKLPSIGQTGKPVALDSK